MRPLINLQELKKDLRMRGMFLLFHANSVETSITFARHGMLFSRERCEKEEYPQSPQYTDNLNKTYGIFNDLFLNFSDLHNIEGPNKYGPISFQFKANETLDYLSSNNFPTSITQVNPHLWQKANVSKSDRWRADFHSVLPYQPNDQKRKTYTDGWPDLVISSQEGALPLSLLNRIIVDAYPLRPTFYLQVRNILLNCLKGHHLDIPILQRRNCKSECKCQDRKKLVSKQFRNKYVTGKWEKEFGKVG